jgi:hypothetical protein
MELVWFTLVAALLYFAADAILRAIESAAGRPLEYRSIVFFALLLGMALASFAVIRVLTD